MSRHRLLHLIDTGGPGGAETVFMRVAAGLWERGYEPVTMVSREGWLSGQCRQQDLAPLINPPGNGRLSYLRRIIEVIRREDVSAVIAHLYGASFYASIAAALTRRPVISVFHGQKDVEGSRLNRVKGRILSLPPGRSVFVSAALLADLRPQLGLSAERCEVIHNGVNIRAFTGIRSGLRQRLGLSASDILVGAVGNIRSPKAYDVLLRAARSAANRDPRLVFVVAGEGGNDLARELEELHRQLQLGDRFRFLGLVDDIPEFLAGLDIFTIASRQEGFSIACVEAMAAGLPVVATRSGGPESIVTDGVTGRLVPVDEPVRLADALIGLAGDDAARAAMGAAGRQRAEAEFSLERSVAAYGRLLDELLPA